MVEGGLCDTATSITVRRPGLSLSRDPVYHGVSRPYTRRNIEPVYPRGCLGGPPCARVSEDLSRSERAIVLSAQGSKGA